MENLKNETFQGKFWDYIYPSIYINGTFVQLTNFGSDLWEGGGGSDPLSNPEWEGGGLDPPVPP